MQNAKETRDANNNQIVQNHFENWGLSFLLSLFYGICPFGWIFAAIDRNSFAISVKLGLSGSSDDQHLSINDLHSGSQPSGTGGRSVLLTIPPEMNSFPCSEARNEKVQIIEFTITFIYNEITNNSPVMQVCIWFFSSEKLPHNNTEWEDINLD